MPLSNSQQTAVTHGEGPAMVLAGPGSGKTMVITNRIEQLITKAQVPAQQILVITFTNAAARQMQERFFKLHKEGKPPVWFGTFHAVFFQILKYAYHLSASNIVKEEDRHRLIASLAAEKRLDSDDEKTLVSDLEAEISLVKNEQIPLEHYYSTTCSETAFRDIYAKYHEKLRAEHLMDFDDMLVWTYDLFSKRPDILALWQKQFSYILVDEFQDINLLQYKVVQMLSKPQDNLFVVGDDDQYIYRFRGAKPDIMLNFQKDYPSAKILYLQENYRSAKGIVDAAGLVIRENKNRFDKEILCKAAGVDNHKSAVEIRRFNSQETENLYMLKQIRQLHEEGMPFNQMAVLTRTNTGGRSLAEKLMEFQVPFVMKDNAPIIYDHWIAKDLFAYLRLGLGIRDRREFLQVINRPVRYIERACLESKTVSFDELTKYYEEKPWMIKRIDQMENDVKMLGRMRPFAAINYIRHGIEYEKFLKEYAQKRRLKDDELLQILEELQESAKPYGTTLEWFEHIDQYRERIKQQREKEQKAGEDAVIFATIHAAKGLEFSQVFLPDVNDGILPFRKATLEADLEEERRLLYVAMTRAKEQLHIFYVKELYGKEQDPSRFLEVFDLPE